MATQAEVDAALDNFVNTVAQIAADAELARQIVQGDETTTVDTDGGPVDSFAKVLASLTSVLPSSFPFRDSGLSPSYSSPTEFTVDGNQTRSGDTGTFFVGQRLQLRDGAVIVAHANVTAVDFDNDTTTVTLDRAENTASVDKIYLGLDGEEGAISSLVYPILAGETGVVDDTRPYWDVRRFVTAASGDKQSQLQNALDSVVNTVNLLRFETQREYALSAKLEVNDDIHLIGNGATLVGANQLLQIGKQKEVESGLAVNLTAGDDTFTVPGAITTLQAGDVVHLYTDADRISGYKHGHWAKVLEVSAGTARMDRGPVEDFSADNMNVWPGVNATVEGLNFDNSAATSVNFFGSLEARGDEINVFGCEFTGSDNATIGLYIKAVTSSVRRNSVHGYINDPGLTGGGRAGYGISVNGGNITVAHNRVWDCKSCITSNERNIQTTAVRFIGNLLFHDPSKAAVNSSEGSDWFTTLMDCHGNADYFVFDANVGFGAGDMVSVGGRSGRVTNNVLVAMDAENGSSAIRSHDAQHKEGLTIKGNRVSYPSDVDGCWFIDLQGMAAGNDNIRILNNRVTNANVKMKTANYDNVRIEGNDFIFAADEKGITLNENGEGAIDFTNLWVRDNTFVQDNADDTIACYAGDYTNVHFTGNHWTCTGGSAATAIDFAVSDIDGLWIKDNRCDNDGTCFEIEADNLNNAHIHGNEVRYGIANNGAAFVVALWLNATNQSNVNVQFNRFELVDDANNTNTQGIQINNENDCRVDFNVLSEAINDASGDYTYLPRGNVFLDSDAAVWKGVKLYEDGRIGLVNDAAPTTETWAVGDVVYDEAPSAGGTMGWVCTTAGEPGTWKTFGSIAA